jgi:uncharacterized membrane protein YkvI
MVVLFDWFPKNGQWMGWIGLAITFTTFTIGGIVVMILKTRYESKQYEKILHDFNDRKVEKNDE